MTKIQKQREAERQRRIRETAPFRSETDQQLICAFKELKRR